MRLTLYWLHHLMVEGLNCAFDDTPLLHSVGGQSTDGTFALREKSGGEVVIELS